jgi:hypothetical protein
VSIGELSVRYAPLDHRSADRRAIGDARLQPRRRFFGIGIESEHFKHLLGLRHLRACLRELAFGLLQRDPRRRLVLEQVPGHRVGFLGELEILVAGQVIRDRRGDFTAAQHEQHVASADGVADVDGEVLYLTRYRRQNLRHPIRVEFDGAGRLDRAA